MLEISNKSGLAIVSLVYGESIMVFGKIPKNAKEYADIEPGIRYKKKFFSPYDKAVSFQKITATSNIIVLLQKFDDIAESAGDCLSIRDDREKDGAIGLKVRRIGLKRVLLYNDEALVADEFGDSHSCGYYIVSSRPHTL